jgi:hypothetical protein
VPLAWTRSEDDRIIVGVSLPKDIMPTLKVAQFEKIVLSFTEQLWDAYLSTIEQGPSN